jgi:CRP-like cAMP-binding protein
MEIEKLKQNLISNIKVDIYANGEVIYKSGDASNNIIYYIIEGEVKIKRDGFSISFTNSLKRGDFFGEVAVINNYPRNETVVVNSDIAKIISLSTLEFEKTISLNKSMLKKLLVCSNNRYNLAISNYLQRNTDVPYIDINQNLMANMRNKNIEITERIHTPNNIFYNERDTIFRENDFSKGSFFILEMGEVVIKKKYSEKREYLSILNCYKGDIFSEQSFFGSEYRKERVIVISKKAKLREINKIAFENLINFKSDFFINFIQNIIWKAYILELKINTL